MIVAYVKLVASEGHVTISLLILDAVRELQVVEHLPVALDEVEASDGPSQVSGISETPGGSQGGWVLTWQLGHLDSVSWQIGDVTGQIKINPLIAMIIRIWNIKMN